MLADVVLPSRRFQTFTYQIPPQFLSQLSVGTPVMVPLGNAILSGFVVRLFDPKALREFEGKPLKDILSLPADPEEHLLDQKLLELVKNISDYYLAPLSACLRLIVPPYSVKVGKRVFLTDYGRSMLLEPKLSPEEQVLLGKLERAPHGLFRSSLTRAGHVTTQTLERLKKKGWVREQAVLHKERKALRAIEHGNPKGQRPNPSAPGLFDQINAMEKHTFPLSVSMEVKKKWKETPIGNAKKGEGFREVAVLGSDEERKDWIEYILQQTIEQGQDSVILTPEVHQAEAIARRLRSRFGDLVEVYHGHLSSSLRAARWDRIHRGNVSVVVGSRLALFLPLPKLGLIWVDQEDNPSYKEEHLPYYHTREVARMRGTIEKALVVYAAKRPSLEMYARFRETMKSCFSRPNHNPYLPELIDMRSLSPATLLSQRMVDRMTETIQAQEQVILLLNRKGFSRALVCLECGQSPTCVNCGVPLKLFHRPMRVMCSYCHEENPPPEVCPSCKGTFFRFSGMGTQRLEEEINKLFPSVSLGCLDRDNVKTVEQASYILHQFKHKALQILIGTELMVHQPVPPKAAMVGFPQADLGLHHPDFRSAERTFHLLEKSWDLTHPSRKNAEVILQTRMPEHHVMQAIHSGKTEHFFEQECQLRQALGYPPFTHLLLFVVTGPQSSQVRQVVEFLDTRLKKIRQEEILDQESLRKAGGPLVLGPMASKKPGQVKKNRTIFLLKTQDLKSVQDQVWDIQQEYVNTFPKWDVVVEINVDPIDIQ